MPDFVKEQLQPLRQRMLDRHRILTEEVREKRRHVASEDSAQAAGGVGDAGDESVTRMITELDLQEVSRDLEEYRDIDAALVRMDDGTYGECVECGAEIDYRRLEVQPTALRCVRCQGLYEKLYAHRPVSTL